MRKNYLPLIFFFLTVIISSVRFTHWNASLLAGLLFFNSGYLTTYLQMVHEIQKNQEAVLKIGARCPFILPFLFFFFPALISFIFFIPQKVELMVMYASLLSCACLTYFCGVFFVKQTLKKVCSQNKKVSVTHSEKKQLILINPVNTCRTGLSINKSSIFPPAGLGIIASLTPDDYEITLIDENIAPFSYVKGDIIGITCFTSTANRAYELAKLYRKENTPVVIGGIHASMVPEEALNYADSVVIGEAEDVWVRLLEDFEHGVLKRLYKGNVIELESLPLPKRDLFNDAYLFATVQTSRGCPMDCYFCSVTPFNGKRFRQRPVADILCEVEMIEQSFIFFIDDNLLGYGKESEIRAIELFKGMVKRKVNKHWFCQSSLNFAQNEEVLYWASKSGCKMVFIGLESADPEELKFMNKRVNLMNEYEQSFKKIHKYGIAVLGAFIFGSDYETVESMQQKTDFIMKSGIDVVQITVLTPLPGTRLFKNFSSEGRLKNKNFPYDWDTYDMSELTYNMKNMSNEKFISTLEKCTGRIYSLYSVYFRFLKTLAATKRLTPSLFALSSNCAYRNIGRTRLRNTERMI
ncbi:MAG: B12-binding domain-containing radical SAM protein [Chitinispirillaceae bacterium]|nr:B12-binding domain-containing radical SAM protein [Chitinispirillaceae bacterium]